MRGALGKSGVVSSAGHGSRRASFKLFFYLEILAGGFFPLCAVAFLVTVDAIPSSVALLYAGIWYGAELLLARALAWPLSYRSFALPLVRDAMLPFLWVAAMCGGGFVWRGNEMHVRSATLSSGDLQLAEE